MDTLLTIDEVRKALGDSLDAFDLKPVGTFTPSNGGKPVKLYSGAEVQRRMRK